MRLFQLASLFLCLSFALDLSAQNNSTFWTAVSSIPVSEKDAFGPTQAASFQLQADALANYLKAAPMEFTPAAKEQALLLDLPGADGILNTYKVVESPIMAPALRAKYPGIRTYSGISLNGSGQIVRLDVGPQGFHAYFFAADGHIQALTPAKAQTGGLYYQAYRMEDFPLDPVAYNGGNIRCGVEDEDHTSKDLSQTLWQHRTTDRDVVVAPVQLKKYRIAVSATGEYSQYFGGNPTNILNAIVTGLNFVVAIQERDFAVRMELVANNDTLIFLDPATDPYTGDLTDWIGQNHLAVNQRIGSSNYDIGHVFSLQVPSSNLAGLAGGRVCSQTGKGRGGSSASFPNTPYFYGVVAHEICHQLSGSHTWNTCTPDIATQRAGSAAYEPGSGSTIMSYAGSCGANNVVSNNDSETYFHSVNIDQVFNFVYEDNGATCGTLVTTDNNPPTATIPLANNFFIPIGTPFVLNGSATDPDNDALTYCWEQFDLGTELPLGQAVGTAPLFRSYFPSTSTSRTFPRIQSIVTNANPITELLPTYSRILTFRMTVRDNHAGGGGIAKAEVQFNATSQAGPFLVTSPNTAGQSWDVGSFKTITWDVSNTNKAPVNCQLVNIKLSTDGGLTYPITLASNVPNNGKHCIQVPANTTNIARIRVEAADNIFFDISNTNLIIKQPTQAGYSFCSGITVDKACLPGGYATVISTASLLGFSSPITLSASGLPSGASATFSPNPVLPGNNVTMTIDFAGNTPENQYDITIQGDAAGVLASTGLSLKLVSNDFSAFALQSPSNGLTGLDVAPVLRWVDIADADAYDVEVATNPNFGPGTLVTSKSNILVDSFQVNVFLNEGTVYYWRVRIKNECGDQDWSDPYVFSTKVQTCNVFTANDLPKIISANGTPTVESKITVNLTGTLSDVNLESVGGSHTFFKDLETRLISPAGTQVLLWKDKCPQSFNFNLGFDDGAPSVFGCPPGSGFISKPVDALSVLNGQEINGVWTLRVKDTEIGSGGTLSAFKLELCSSTAQNPPFIVNNNVLNVQGGANALVTTDLLKVDDLNTSPFGLLYTMVTIPDHGILELDGTVLQVGDKFPQAAIDQGVLRYFDYGLNLGTDDFRFAVTDGEGGMVAGTFVISPTTGVKDANQALNFILSPNPASDAVRLSFQRDLATDTQVFLYNAAGQQLRQWTLANGQESMLLNIQDLPEGIYAFSVQNADGIGVKKVIIRR
jgi:subtilisin-like proprotein convertase family protein